ncbi:Esterase E4 [Orchesella cincta]|uniref:Esterase E4 n=1 Tax=Orchesella cincta TaxID=48709 RepID=A0A1D2MQ09_ORCCI|nr:Esterase E4 [Orchesella cincta]
MSFVFLFNLFCAITDCTPPVSHTSPGRNELSILSLASMNSAISLDERSARSHSNNLSDLRDDFPIVRTSLGEIEGHFMESRGGRKIAAFEGIPFALPPVGERRFRNPVPLTPWKGILSAKKPGNDCLQLDISRQMRVRGSESCLYLSIYTPAPLISNNRTKLLNVIFYIHGGCWESFSGKDFGPQYLLDKDTILVTSNYRLGILGFLSTGDRAARGNYGMKDQLEALKWTVEHISNFGGDPKKITVIGESVGAASVGLHIISPLTSKALHIHGAIMLSGSGLNHWTLINDTFSNSKEIAKRMHCPTANSEDLVECLRHKDPYMVVGQQFHLWKIPVVIRMVFGPVIESNVDNPDPFIVEAPEVTYSKPNAIRPIPVICGVNKNEGALFAASIHIIPFLYDAINSKRDEMISYIMDYDTVPGVNLAETSTKISKFYFNDKPWSNINRDRISDALGDRSFTSGVYKFLQRHSQVAPTYGYFFTHESTSGSSFMSQTLGLRKNEWGTSHGDELPFIFSMDRVSQDFTDPKDMAISKFLVDVIVNFSNDKQPFPQNAVGENVTWSPILNPKYMELLEINDKTRMIPFPYMERMKFWEHLKLN